LVIPVACRLLNYRLPNWNAEGKKLKRERGWREEPLSVCEESRQIEEICGGE
jgi:hypothetical protein